MKKLLLLCTQEVPFTFNEEIYMQVDGVMMGSPLGSLFANIFMCELENTLIPKLNNSITEWTRYVGDTFTFIKSGYEGIVQTELNSYHRCIKFTYDLEQDNKISFLDVLITKTSNKNIETSVYRKPTNTDIYMNWMSHAPTTWKIATLKSLIKRAFLISSTKVALEDEINYLNNVFCNYNDYPSRLVEEIIKNERKQQNKQEENTNTNEENETPVEEEKTSLTINLPYAGDKGQNIMSKVQKYVKNAASKGNKEIRVCATYKSRKLGTCFNIKDQIKFEHMHNVVYHAKCPNKKCKSHYGGQTKCRIAKRGLQHKKSDKNSHLLKHSLKTKHKRVNLHDFKIIGKGYKSDFKRRISESIHIKKLKPDLNVQKEAYKLSLFN